MTLLLYGTIIIVAQIGSVGAGVVQSVFSLCMPTAGLAPIVVNSDEKLRGVKNYHLLPLHYN